MRIGIHDGRATGPVRRHRARAWGGVVLVLLSAAASVAGTPGTAAPSKPSEYAVKAAYLLNFGKFLRVPPNVESKRTSFNICVVGPDPFGRELDNVAANETVDGRPVRVVRVEKLDGSQNCAIAYISPSEKNAIEQQLAAVRGSETLTVSDAPDFLQRGGMIQLLLVSNHIRFSVNLQAVRRTHLVLSSDLLRVAASVVGDDSGEVGP